MIRSKDDATGICLGAWLLLQLSLSNLLSTCFLGKRKTYVVAGTLVTYPCHGYLLR